MYNTYNIIFIIYTKLDIIPSTTPEHTTNNVEMTEPSTTKPAPTTTESHKCNNKTCTTGNK